MKSFRVQLKHYGLYYEKTQEPGTVLLAQYKTKTRESLGIQKHNVSRIQKLRLKPSLNQQHKEVKSQ